MTLVYGVLDLRTWRLELVSAGHPAPMLRRAAGAMESQEIVAHPLGLFPAELAQFTTWDVALEPGDRRLFVSDGVLEATGYPEHNLTNPSEAFGADRLEHIWQATGTVSVEDALTSVMDELAGWRGRGRLDDDITALAVGRMSNP